MAKSIYSQLNQAANVGANTSRLLEEIFVGNPDVPYIAADEEYITFLFFSCA